jgi:hypothetical protein
MWTATTETIDGGRILKTAIRQQGRTIRTTDVIELWQHDASFRTFFAALLAGAPFDGYFWECPPVTAAAVTQPFEFVLVDSPPLAHMVPDQKAFASHFTAGNRSDDIATFCNLAGDALLVAPYPTAPVSAYSHLAAFARNAPAEQQQALWRAVGDALKRRLSTQPVWLSTSGLGVAWLHIRLDSQPKYYTYRPYWRLDI